MKVSIVVPVFNEDANLEEFLRRVLAVLDGRGGDFEVILVDDGSRDRSLEILKSWAARRPDRVRVLELSRNFGQHQAILAGFRDVTGDVVVTLDADLQNPPEEIPSCSPVSRRGTTSSGACAGTVRIRGRGGRPPLSSTA